MHINSFISCILSSAVFFQTIFFEKQSLMNTLRVSKSLEPHQADTMSGLISAEDIGRQIVEVGVPLGKDNCICFLYPQTGGINLYWTEIYRRAKETLHLKFAINY